MVEHFFSVGKNQMVEIGLDDDLFYCDLIDLDFNIKVDVIVKKNLNCLIQKAIEKDFFINMSIADFSKMYNKLLSCVEENKL